MSGLPPLSTLASELLAKERARGPEDAALKQRVLARAREALHEDRPSGIALSGGERLAWPAARRRAPRAALLVAATVAMAGLAAAGAGLYRWQAEGPAVRPFEVRRTVSPRSLAEVPKAQAPKPSVVTEAPPPQSAPREGAISGERATSGEGASSGERATSGRVSDGTHAAPSVQTYALEAGLLEPARRDIGSGNYSSAMTAIARHQREYPRGQLAEEREALRVRALWGMGQRPAAESAAAAFRKRYPRSVLLSWMKGQAKPVQ